MHGDTRQVPVRQVTISAPPGAWALEVGIVPDLPVPVLLGRDWLGFEQLLTAVIPPANRGAHRKESRGRQSALMANESEHEGESQHGINNLFLNLYQQITAGGSFGKEQREDDQLRNCWHQVQIDDGQVRQPASHPMPYFLVQNGLLYCVTPGRGEEKLLLVVPKTKMATVIELAHTHPIAGHLGASNTIQRIRDSFHWPGLEAEVKRFCQSCPTYQRTSPACPCPNPLIPLPIIEVPFESIGMDLVGPLPKFT